MLDLFILLAMIFIIKKLSSTEEVLSEVLKKLDNIKSKSVNKEDHYKLMDKIIDIEYDLRGIEIELKYSS